MSTILIIDDDPYIRELVRAVLTHEGFDVLEAADGRAAFELMGTQALDLCIVDVMMPRMDGNEFARTARRYYEDLPLLMLTARAQLGDKAESFGSGADDYLTKPFEAAELVMRVRALLRRYHKVAALAIEVGLMRIDKVSHTLTVKAVPVELPLKEFELLFVLASQAGRTLTRQQLLDEVWGIDFYGNERTLDVHINRLRERFAPESCGFSIVTVRGLGYRLEVAA